MCECHHQTGCSRGECCACEMLRHQCPAASAANRRRIYFEGEIGKHRRQIEEAVRRFEPAAKAEWEDGSLELELPEEDAARLPVLLRSLTAWLKENLPQIGRNYDPPAELGEDDDGGEEEGGIFARCRIQLITAGILLFAAAVIGKRFFPSSAYIGLCFAAYLCVGGEIVSAAVRRLLHGGFLDECFLMTAASFGALAIGEYPEAAAVMLFYQVGEAFQRRAVGKSRGAIAAMMNLRPDTAHLLTDGGVIDAASEEVAVGESIVVRPGERVPLDGVVADGETLLDTSALTGESFPREAAAGTEVLSGSIVQSGQITLKVTRTSGESAIARILELVQHASSRRTPTERFITTFSRYYTPTVVIGALLLAVLPPLLTGGAWSGWIHRALVFLVVSCPCALVISVPLSYFGGIGAASRQKILVKGSACIDALAKVSTVVFDKTGTLTLGAFEVTDVVPAAGFSRDELLDHAAHAESASNHPIAEALRRAAPRPVDPCRVTNIEEVAGHGVRARLDGREVLAGNRRFLLDQSIGEIFTDAFGTVVHVAIEGKYAGTISIADRVKPDSALAVEALRREGVRRILMLTGDHRSVAEETASLLGLDGFRAELLPGQKVEFFEELEREKPAGSKIAFVGDGINDAPVLARADLGVAMGGIGADAAVDAADAVLMTDQPSQLAVAIRIARKTLAIARQNIVFALGVKGVILVLGALGIANLWLAVFGDVGVAALATLNATRTLRADR
ncbi:MAG: cadmium-translocating P-type ATPase [Thermoguttaceae bacterium]|nr:cadmium-translocating P-type ATPase [Thermoguttaceae bacterium]